MSTWRQVLSRAMLLAASAALVLPAAAQTAPGAPAPVAPIYSAPQLDQMLAPIALYPDDLLGQILMAATYPLEIVQADRWLQNPSNAGLRDNDLAQALQAMPWDASVKSLVAYPQILNWMDNGLDWTEAVGDAFLAQQSDVMDSVQRLRARAQSAGSLSSTPQETINAGDQGIQIASSDPNIEYVPVYNPQAAYGDWPYPDYPPDEFYAPGYAMGTFIAFPILVGFWGWDHWDWRHHRIDIDRGVGPGFHGGHDHDGHDGHDGRDGRDGRGPVAWRHDPTHRGGVPYRDPVTRSRFEGVAQTHTAQSNYRGYNTSRQSAQPAAAPPRQPTQFVGEAARPAAPPPMARAPVAERPVPPPMARAPVAERPVPPPAPRPQAAPRPMPVERPVSPVMESFGRGEQVQVQEQRGFTSRAGPPPAPPAAAPRGHR